MAMDLIIQRRLPYSEGGRFASECPADLERNRWPVWIGMGGRFASEYARSSSWIVRGLYEPETCVITINEKLASFKV